MFTALPALRGVWRSDAITRAVYSEAAGIHQLVPLAVAIPADADDVVTLVRWAAEHGVPLTPRGSGSSMAGAAVGAGVLVDLSRLQAIGAIDLVAKSVVVGPGAICADVDAAARTHGLRFPVDPSSARFCTIGGMTATNAAGAHTLRFGQMNAWVEGLECVLADGSRGWVRRGAPVPGSAPLARFTSVAESLLSEEHALATRHDGVRKESSGYGLAAWSRSKSIIDLLVGSEGTLALFTAVKLRLAPLPGASATVLAAFSSIEGAAAAALIAAELNASACELLDRTFLEIARQGGPLPVPDDADAVLLVEIEDAEVARLEELTTALAVAFRDAGASHVERTLDPRRAARLWHLRHAASPILAGMSRRAIPMQVIEDGAVPPVRLPDYVRGLRALLDRYGFGGVIFGHAGDAHVHANVLVDTAEADWNARLHALFRDAVAFVSSLGGTMTGEHGDGRLRAGALADMWPAASVERFRAIKTAFDPQGILNPGVKLPGDGAPTFGAPNKYDPKLPPLPEPARRALDRVQRERAWNRSRIDVLNEETPR